MCTACRLYLIRTSKYTYVIIKACKECAVGKEHKISIDYLFIYQTRLQ